MIYLIFFSNAFRLLNNKGQIFLDTKNANWEEFQKPGFNPEDTHLWFDMSDLEESAKDAGFTVRKSAGFLPDTCDIVECNKSHTIFLIAEKSLA